MLTTEDAADISIESIRIIKEMLEKIVKYRLEKRRKELPSDYEGDDDSMIAEWYGSEFEEFEAIRDCIEELDEVMDEYD